MKRKTICFVSTTPNAADFLKEQISDLSKDFDICLASNGEYSDMWKQLNLKNFHSILILRKISLVNDFRALLALTSYFRTNRFDAVQSITPKGGLICALAGFLAGIKHRSHIFTGQVWATRKGFSKLFLKSLDWMICHLDNHIFADGNGQKNFLIREHIIDSNKISVFANGSISGILVDKFKPSEQIKATKRAELNISDEKVVFVFAGRLNRDKGCYELFEAFNHLLEKCENAFLLLFGVDEENVMSSFPKYTNLVKGENFLFYGLTREIFNMMQASDVFVLPTHREGFGVSVLEAQALELPVITSDTYGVVDASVNGVTGIHVETGNWEALCDAMEKLYYDKELRVQYGKKGRERVLAEFRCEYVVKAWHDFYHSILD